MDRTVIKYKPTHKAPEPRHLPIGATPTLRTDARCAIADGLFFAKLIGPNLAGNAENRPIDADCHWKRANGGSSKFPFEFKSANF